MAKLAFAVAFLAIALSTQADTIVNVSATTCSCSTSPISIDLQAQFDVQQASGNFFDAGISDFIGFSGPVEQVVSISGTLNGFAMTLAAPLQGAGSWLTLHNFGLQPFQLGTVYFEADGLLGLIFNDNAFNVVEWSGASTPIYWNVTALPVSTPEPGALALVAIGLCAVTVSRRYRFGRGRPA
jgi:hypothetical protein